MKPFSLILLLGFLVQWSYSQTPTVEKSVWGIQTGLLGLWVHNESRIADEISFRTELGVDAGLWGNNDEIEGFAVIPVIRVEPRWYYNLKRRVNKSKRIDGNSGNFWAIELQYRPNDNFAIWNNENGRIVPDFSIFPNYGLRRNLGQHFNYEVAFGIRYINYLNESRFSNLDDEILPDVKFRIGYRF